MDPNLQSVKQAIFDHCREAGISFEDFVDIWAGRANEDPEVFDAFFEFKWEEISEEAKDARVELLMDIFTE